MLDMLQRQLPYEEKQDGDKLTKTSTIQPLAVGTSLVLRTILLLLN